MPLGASGLNDLSLLEALPLATWKTKRRGISPADKTGGYTPRKTAAATLAVAFHFPPGAGHQRSVVIESGGSTTLSARDARVHCTRCSGPELVIQASGCRPDFLRRRG